MECVLQRLVTVLIDVLDVDRWRYDPLSTVLNAIPFHPPSKLQGGRDRSDRASRYTSGALT